MLQFFLNWTTFYVNSLEKRIADCSTTQFLTWFQQYCTGEVLNCLWKRVFSIFISFFLSVQLFCIQDNKYSLFHLINRWAFRLATLLLQAFLLLVLVFHYFNLVSHKQWAYLVFLQSTVDTWLELAIFSGYSHCNQGLV